MLHGPQEDDRVLRDYQVFGPDVAVPDRWLCGVLHCNCAGRDHRVLQEVSQARSVQHSECKLNQPHAIALIPELFFQIFNLLSKISFARFKKLKSMINKYLVLINSYPYRFFFLNFYKIVTLSEIRLVLIHNLHVHLHRSTSRTRTRTSTATRGTTRPSR